MLSHAARPKGVKRKLLCRTLLLINIGFIQLLLISYLASFASPVNLWWLEFFTLSYGIFLSINIFFVLFWLLLRERYFLYSLIAIFIGINKVSGIFQFHFSGQKNVSSAHSQEHPQLKVMTYNVHVFDLYNWYHDHEYRPKILALLGKESPDIVCLQEFYSSTRKDYRYENADTLKKILAASYAHIEYTLTLRGTDHWGIATYSKYPIINQQAVHFNGSQGNIFIYSDIVAGIDTFRVFNVHLESDRFQPADYRFIKDLQIGKSEDSKVNGYWKRIKSIVVRLKDGTVKRGMQAPLMRDYIAKSPYPVIVYGDFNDTPASYTYHVLSENLKDAFRESGSGFGQTYSGAFPSFRIDYILHDKRIESYSYKTGKENYSDHYPVSCIIQRKD